VDAPPPATGPGPLRPLLLLRLLLLRPLRPPTPLRPPGAAPAQAASPEGHGPTISGTYIPEHIDLEAKLAAAKKAAKATGGQADDGGSPASGPAAVRASSAAPRMGLEADAAPNLLVH
jgi:hypothetical protein